MNRRSLLIVDDNAVAVDMLCQLFQSDGFSPVGVGSAEEALALFQTQQFGLVISDLQLPGMDGLGLLRRLKEMHPEVEFILITAYATIEIAVQAIKMGAFDFVTKPINPGELEHKVQAAWERQRLRAEVERLHGENAYLWEEVKGRVSRLSGQSMAIRKVMDRIERVAAGDSTVLIRGESGTGKELVARAIHDRSPRADRPFIRVNTAALAEGVLESELFGHERGSFTGALKRKLGKFELARDGTLFLDEIGDISPGAQVKLLRCLQEREFERVGGHDTLKVHCRILAATHHALEERIQQGTFRQDLYYRLNVVPITLPPLRERREDIPLLIAEFLNRFNRKADRQTPAPSLDTLRRFMDYSWPGNIRELENLVERGVVLGSLDAEGDGLPPAPSAQSLSPHGFQPGGEVGLQEYLERIEQQILSEAYRRSTGNKSQAAALLGIDRNLLRYKLQKYRLI